MARAKTRSPERKSGEAPDDYQRTGTKLESGPPKAEVTTLATSQPKWVGVLFGSVIAIALVGLAIVILPKFLGEKGKAVHIVRNSAELDGLTQVVQASYKMDLHNAFYTRIPISLHPGNYVLIQAEGKGLWDAQASGERYEVVTPNGAPWKAKDLNGQFLKSDAPVVSLIGVIGPTVEYNEGGEPKVVDGTKHFFIGTQQIVQVPEDVEGKLYLAMNERWQLSSWADNYGDWIVKVTVWR